MIDIAADFGIKSKIHQAHLQKLRMLLLAYKSSIAWSKPLLLSRKRMRYAHKK